MLQDYIQRRLLAKNRSVYFKKGKWVFHVVCIALIWGLTYARMKPATGPMPPGAGWVSLVGELPFLLFFYYYCLYLIPVCFKQNRYRRFWTILLVLLAVVPWIETALQLGVFRNYPLLDNTAEKRSGIAFVWKVYRDFGIAFLGFTAVLFLMELTEGIRTTKETTLDAEALAQTEVQLLKTRMDPAFMTRSLDAIIALTDAQNPHAPEAVVQFSDVLRYRLYRSRLPRVALAEELEQLQNLFRLHQSQGAGEVSLEIESDFPEISIPPLLLLNLAEPFLTLVGSGKEANLLLYILAEPEALQIAIELTTEASPEAVAARLQQIETEGSRIAGITLNFTITSTPPHFSIQLCLPLPKALPALS